MANVTTTQLDRILTYLYENRHKNDISLQELKQELYFTNHDTLLNALKFLIRWRTIIPYKIDGRLYYRIFDVMSPKAQKLRTKDINSTKSSIHVKKEDGVTE